MFRGPDADSENLQDLISGVKRTAQLSNGLCKSDWLRKILSTIIRFLYKARPSLKARPVGLLIQFVGGHTPPA
jgi:hypothetical protein